jgi:hypothetical protein
MGSFNMPPLGGGGEASGRAATALSRTKKGESQ